jgi:hypothetical protein
MHNIFPVIIPCPERLGPSKPSIQWKLFSPGGGKGADDENLSELTVMSPSNWNQSYECVICLHFPAHHWKCVCWGREISFIFTLIVLTSCLSRE